MAQEKTISNDEVCRVAHLARLVLTDEEQKSLRHDLARILNYVQKLEELDTQDVVATSHALLLPTVMREDIVGKGLGTELALREAPERLGDGFGVPKIIE